MKYIRGQDGGIFSIGELHPPCAGTHDGERIWSLRVLTLSGDNCLYATYSTEAAAVLTYKHVTEFMADGSSMIEFTLGANGICHKRPAKITDCVAIGHDTITTERIVKGRIERKDIRLKSWWEFLWPWSRKGDTE